MALPRCSAILLALVVLPPAALPAQTDTAPAAPMTVPRLTGAIELDGRVDEPAWQAIDPLPATEHVPTFRGQPTERTEFRVAYDDRYIYFSCRAYDSDPSGIRAPSLQRDVGSFSNDWCVIDLDPFNDNETALVFGTNPAGVRTEVVFPKDGTAAGNFSWNTFWDAAVSRDDRGWYAEIRIPLSSLRFQPEPGTDRVVMGMAVWRNIARKNEIHTWPAISPRWGVPISFLKASQFRDVAFRGIRPHTPLYITPYALGGVGRTHGLDDAGTAYTATNDRVSDVGLDAKYGLASNLTLDVTVNTDFAQVEADDQQVNLTRFSLFFPEKRQFFQERADIFDVPLGGSNRVFHSRRIGIVDGEQVPIRGGARLVGRMGQWDVGVIDMQTAPTALAPGENMGVLRLRRRVLNANSFVGGILTSRVAEAGQGANLVVGADAVVRLFGQDYLTVDIVGSRTDTLADDPTLDALDRSLLRVAWDRRGVDGFTYSLDAVRAGAAFRPDLGFLRRRDYTSASTGLAYGWRPGDASPVLTHGPSLDASVFARNDDGTVETVVVEPRWELDLKSGHGFAFGATFTRENLDAGFGLPDSASVPAGRYSFVQVELGYDPPAGRLLRAGATVSAGGFYDGRLMGARISPTWNASRHLELGGSYGIDAVTFRGRRQSFTSRVARIRARVMFSTKVALFAFVQYSSTADRLAANLRFRYNPAEGHDLYIVWNEGLVTNRRDLDPVPPLSERRTLLIKYSRTLTFGL